MKADRLLEEAEAMLSLSFHESTGRAAYLAGFHAAQALIFERTGRTVRTHRGVQAELHRLIKDDSRFDFGLRAFLGRAYALKAIADYETGSGTDVDRALAVDAVDGSRRFVAHIRAVIDQD